MTDNDRPADETQPVRPGGAPADQPAATPVTAPAATTEVPPVRRGFRERFRRASTGDHDRAYSLGALIASALAGIIVGGAGLATVHAITHDGPDRPDRGWHGPMGRDLGRPGGTDHRGPFPGGPGGGVPPTTPPEDDEDSGSSS